MFRWFHNLFRPLPDENAPKIRALFSFLIDDYGFSFETEDLGDAVDRNGRFFYYGPLYAYYLYNDNVCINILYLEQREEYSIYITDSHKRDQAYIRNGTMIDDSDASYPDRYALMVKASLEERGEICGRKIQVHRPGKRREGELLVQTTDRTADVEVIFNFNGIRRTPARNGYRPAHDFGDGHVTGGIHHYYDVEELAPDGTARGTITFFTPECFPASVWVGKVIPIQEGARIVGTATVEKILNPILERK